MKFGILEAASVAALIVLVASTADAGVTAPHGAVMSPSAIRLAADQADNPIDINSASEDALRVLPGVGPARAQAIAAGRPYKGKDDLVKKNILPKNVYYGIKDRIVARQK